MVRSVSRRPLAYLRSTQQRPARWQDSDGAWTRRGRRRNRDNVWPQHSPRVPSLDGRDYRRGLTVDRERRCPLGARSFESVGDSDRDKGECARRRLATVFATSAPPTFRRLDVVASMMLTGRKVSGVPYELIMNGEVLRESPLRISKYAEQPVPPELDEPAIGHVPTLFPHGQLPCSYRSRSGRIRTSSPHHLQYGRRSTLCICQQ